MCLAKQCSCCGPSWHALNNGVNCRPTATLSWTRPHSLCPHHTPRHGLPQAQRSKTSGCGPRRPYGMTKRTRLHVTAGCTACNRQRSSLKQKLPRALVAPTAEGCRIQQRKHQAQGQHSTAGQQEDRAGSASGSSLRCSRQKCLGGDGDTGSWNVLLGDVGKAFCFVKRIPKHEQAVSILWHMAILDMYM